MVSCCWLYILCMFLQMRSINGDLNKTANKTYNTGDLFNQIYSSVDWLKTELIQNYPTYKHDNETFPPPKGSEVTFNDNGDISAIFVDVQCYISIERIVKMDVEQQALTLVFDEIYLWNDKSLSWNASDENLAFPIDYVSVGSNKVWKPNMYADNALDGEDFFVSPIMALNDGHTWIRKKSEYLIPCAVNVRSFPFDIHNCNLLLISEIDGILSIRFPFEDNSILSDKVPVSKNNYSHLEWEVLHTLIKPEGHENNSVRISITLQRQGKFYATVLIFPLILLNILSLVIFTLPLESTERENFALTLMLTYFVLIMIIIDSSPPTGNQMPLLGLYIMICTGIVVLEFGMSLVLIEMHEHCRQKKRKMPKCLSFLLERYCCLAKHYKNKYDASVMNTKGDYENDYKFENKEDNLLESKKKKKAIFIDEEFKHTEEYEVLKWRVLSSLLNNVFCVIVLALHIIIPILISAGYIEGQL